MLSCRSRAKENQPEPDVVGSPPAPTSPPSPVQLPNRNRRPLQESLVSGAAGSVGVGSSFVVISRSYCFGRGSPIVSGIRLHGDPSALSRTGTTSGPVIRHVYAFLCEL